MNLDDAAERDAAAAEYVLGTLAGAERADLERALQDDSGLRALVTLWEGRLAGLAAVVPPQPPPPEVWERVRRSVSTGPRPEPEASPGPVPPTSLERIERVAARLRLQLRLWQAATALAAAALIGVLVYQQLLAPRPSAVPLVAVLQPADADAAWLMEAGGEGATVRPVGAPALPPGKSFELWAVPGAGAPVSLGLLGEDRATVLDLGGAARARLTPGALLALSIEPAGGSPTGAPTGPIVYSGRLAPLSATAPSEADGPAPPQGELPAQLTAPAASNP